VFLLAAAHPPDVHDNICQLQLIVHNFNDFPQVGDREILYTFKIEYTLCPKIDELLTGC
jgi:hypothetical protein